MKTKLFIAIALTAVSAFGQTALTSTTLSAAITVNQNVFSVASATGIIGSVAGNRSLIYVLDKNQCRGELMTVVNVNSTTLTVIRGAQFRAPHVSGAYVIIGSQNNEAASFQEYDPVGSVTATNTLFTPWINVNNGNQWLASTLTGAWVPGWCNTNNVLGVTADVASVAGATLPSGPLFTTTGTNAITSWTLPVGFSGGTFCTMPTGAFTWTTAGNIGLAGTAVVGRVLCFTWNSSTGKWYPSYV